MASALPLVDWSDVSRDRPRFLTDLRSALADVGFCVLVNHPDFADDVQQRMFRASREFFSAPAEAKRSADISLTPYYRGWSMDQRAEKGRIPSLLAQEAFQYSFDTAPDAAHDDATVPVWKRLFKGPNTWPDAARFPDFKPAVSELTSKYHALTHDLGHLICESIGADPACFDALFSRDDPDLAASINHNFGMDGVPRSHWAKVRAEYTKPFSPHTGAHIDGPPFVALLINDRPGLQVVAGEGGHWINAPVTCRTAPGDYPVPVIPGAVIVNSGGTLMHLSRGRVVATLHRVNTTLIPAGESRVSLPFFLLPTMEGVLEPFFDPNDGKRTGYQEDRDRGVNAAVNRMGTFPTCTRAWWREEYSMLRDRVREEVVAETSQAFKLAQERGTAGREASL